MSGKWTPGPWEYVESTKICGAYVGALTSGTICDCYFTMANGGIYRHQSEQSDANARLISASPELYEALEALLADARELLVSATSCADREDLNADDLEERGFAPDSFAKARAALARAKGEGA